MSDEPSVLDKAKGIVEATIEVAKDVVEGNSVISSEEQIQARLSICRICPQFNGKNCSLCGCYMNFKTKLKSSKCPMGKW